VSLVIYAGLSFTTVATHRLRLKLITYVVLAAVFVVGLFAAAQSVPQIAEVMGTRATLEQPYDVGPNGRFGGQIKAVSLILTHPLGIGALEFARVYDNEDAHEVYLSMFLNAGWIGGTLYLAMVLLTLGLGLRQVVRDRCGEGLSVVLVAAFIGMAFEGVVIDTDHWRHFYLLMAMIWGMALAAPYQRLRDLSTSQRLSARSLPDQANDQEQQNRAERGGDDGGEDTTAEVKAEARKQGAGNQRADDADQNIAKQTEAGALHQLSGQPSGNRPNKDGDQ
jgi:O-antigen ligase